MFSYSVRSQAWWMTTSLILLLLVIAWVAADAGRVVYRLHEQLSTRLGHLNEDQLLAQQLRTTMLQLRRQEKDFLLADGNLQYMQIALNKWHQASAEAHHLLAQSQQHWHGEWRASGHQHVLSQGAVQEALRSYETKILQVFELKMADGNHQDASEHLLRNAKSHSYQFDDLLEAEIKLVTTQAQQLRQHAVIDRDQLLWQFGLRTGGILLLCACLGGWAIRQSSRMASTLQFDASHDGLTHLLNRIGLEWGLSPELAGGGQLLCIDIDNFKLVNDTCGHAVGDDLLISLAATFAQCVPAQALLARLDADRFAVWLSQHDGAYAHAIAEQVLLRVKQQPLVWQGRMFQLSASIGIASFLPGMRYRELMSRADAAGYLAKRKGRGNISHFEDHASQLRKMQEGMEWASRIPTFIQENRFVLYYQKIVPLHEAHPDEIPKAEVLLRGLDEQGRLIPPGHFLPAAERYGLMLSIDRWVISQLLKNPPLAAMRLSVNLSVQTMSDPHFLLELEQMVSTSSFPPERLCFEITESAAMGQIEVAQNYIERLGRLGCSFSLDDFGSGFSSFAYLKRLKVGYLKIDGSLIQDVQYKRADYELVQAIVNMANALGLQTVAEYVETAQQASLLAEMGVAFGQGFGLHKPEPLCLPD